MEATLATATPTLDAHVPVCLASPHAGRSRRTPTRLASVHRRPAPATVVATSRHVPSSGLLAMAMGRPPCRRTVVVFGTVRRTNARMGQPVVVRHAAAGPRSRLTSTLAASRDAPPVGFDGRTGTLASAATRLAVGKVRGKCLLAWSWCLKKPGPYRGDYSSSGKSHS